MQETNTRSRLRRLAVAGMMMLALTGASILTSTSAQAAAPAPAPASVTDAKAAKSQSFTVLSAKENPGGATVNVPLAGFCSGFLQSGATFTFTCTVIVPVATIYLFCTNGNIFAGTFLQGTYELTAYPCFAQSYYIT